MDSEAALEGEPGLIVWSGNCVEVEAIQWYFRMLSLEWIPGDDYVLGTEKDACGQWAVGL